MEAVPALVNCAVPSRWMSVQCGEEASQKFTAPVGTGVVPASTVAVRVTADPLATLFTWVPPEVTASIVLDVPCVTVMVWTTAVAAA